MQRGSEGDGGRPEECLRPRGMLEEDKTLGKKGSKKISGKIKPLKEGGRFK